MDNRTHGFGNFGHIFFFKKMKIIRINNLLLFEILSISFEGESWGDLTYSTKFRSEKLQVQKVVITSDCLLLKTNHFETYKITGDFEIYDTNLVSIIFGVIKVNGHTTVEVSGKEIKLAIGIYEIRTRNTVDTYSLGNKRWEISESKVLKKGEALTTDEEFYEIYSTFDSCGSYSNVTNVAHSDYNLYLYRDFFILLYNHDCNGRGSNGLEFSCIFVFYNNYIYNRSEVTEVSEKLGDFFYDSDHTMRIEVPIFSKRDSPDDIFKRTEAILKSMSRRMLLEERIRAPKKIILILKGLFQELESWEHPENTFNDYSSLLQLIDEPLILNIIIKKYGFSEFIKSAKIQVLDENFNATLYDIKNKKRLLALKNQDATFDISEIPLEVNNISKAIFWSFGLTQEDVNEFQLVIL